MLFLIYFNIKNIKIKKKINFKIIKIKKFIDNCSYKKLKLY